MRRSILTSALLISSIVICGCQHSTGPHYVSSDAGEWSPVALERCNQIETRQATQHCQNAIDHVLTPILQRREKEKDERMRRDGDHSGFNPGFTLAETFLYRSGSADSVSVLLACYRENGMAHSVESDVIVICIMQKDQVKLCEALTDRLYVAGPECVKIWRYPQDRSRLCVFLGTYGECFQGFAPVSLDVWELSSTAANRKLFEIRGPETQIGEELANADVCEPFELKIRSYCGQLHAWCRLARPYNDLIERGEDDVMRVGAKAEGVDYHPLAWREFLLTVPQTLRP